MNHCFLLVNQSFLSPETNFTLALGKYILGRSASCDLVVPDSSLSRRHCEITVVDASLMVRDLESSTGTFIDGSRVQSCTLKDGQRVQFGRVVFLVALNTSTHQQFGLEDETHDPRYPERKITIEEANAILSPAQARVLDWLLEGYSEKQVAYKLTVSSHTVHNHVREIYRALNVHSRSALLAMFLSSPG